MKADINFLSLLRNSRSWIDQDLIEWQQQKWSLDFAQALRHVLLNAGKAFRPALCFWAAKTLSHNSMQSKPSSGLLRCGLALEFMHTYSLIHDDLPAMDNDSFRRSRPTLHILKGEAFAILAGDALLTSSFECLAEAFACEPEKLPKAISILARAGGAEGMIEGQWQDICAEGTPLQGDSLKLLAKLENIHDLKTGALLGASVSLGALQALSLREFNAHEKSFYAWGVQLGRLFQMVDDCLDVVATKESLGKTTGKDQQQGKLSYPALMGLEACFKSIEQLKKDLSQNSLWSNSESTKELLDFVSQRTH